MPHAICELFIIGDVLLISFILVRDYNKSVDQLRREVGRLIRLRQVKQHPVVVKGAESERNIETEGRK